MGTVTYIGPHNPALVNLGDGSDPVPVYPGTAVSLPDAVCARLLTMPSYWLAGDQHTAALVPQSVSPGVVNVRDFGAHGDGSTDDTAAINAAIASLASGPGSVIFPPGIYVVGGIIVGDSQCLVGSGKGATVIKRAPGFNGHVVTTTGYGTTGAAKFEIRDLSIDGNKGANVTYNAAAGGIVLDGWGFVLSNIEIHDCLGDGLSSQQSASDSATGFNMMAEIEGVDTYHNNGSGYKWFGPHDSTHVHVMAWSNGSSAKGIWTGGSTGANHFVNCHAYGPQGYAWYLESSALISNSQAEGAVNGNVFLGCDNNQWIGGRVFQDSNTGNGTTGFVFGDATHTAFNTRIAGVSIENTTTATFLFNHSGGSSQIQALVTLASGAAVVNGLASAAGTIRWDVVVTGGGTLGAGIGSYGQVDWNHTTRNQARFDFGASLGALGVGVLSGTIANRPAASSTLNGLDYWATDNLILYRCISGSWVQITGRLTVGAWGIPRTIDPALRQTSVNVNTANRAWWMRVKDSGAITKLRVNIGAQSGNVSVAVAPNVGSGVNARPGNPTATASQACPAVGDTDIALGATINVNDGDWFGIAADNTVATFGSAAPGVLDSALGSGSLYYQAAAYPIPGTTGTLIASTGRPFVILGVQ